MVKKLVLLILVLLLGANVYAQEGTISLTASDGTGLELQELEVRAVIDGMIVFTEVHMSFYNPEERQREGRFAMLLPDNASVSRFAMEIGNKWQEGEIVETQKARQTYEDFLHRRQDPALLEQDSANYYRARIFPIAPRTKKRIILSYSHQLINTNTYSFPLKGLSKLNNLKIKVMYKTGSDNQDLSNFAGSNNNWKVWTSDKTDYQPIDNFDFNLELINSESALYYDDMYAYKFKPFAKYQDEKETTKEMVVAIDSSASQALDFESHCNEVETLLAGLLKEGFVKKITLISFDVAVKEYGEIDKDTQLKSAFKDLKKHKALGASNFSSLVNYLEKKKDSKEFRLLLVSDGVATYKEENFTNLTKGLELIDGIQRVDCLGLSSYRSLDNLKKLSMGGKKSGLVLDGSVGLEKMIKKLSRKTFKALDIAVPGALWYWPKEVKGLQADDEVVVFAQMDKEKTFKLYAGEEIVPVLKQTEGQLIKREWVRARIKKLIDMEEKTKDLDLKNAYHNQVIKLSVEERVLSPYTSLLVLETEFDYRRYNIERNALTDILTIGMDGLELIEREGIELRENFPQVWSDEIDVIGGVQTVTLGNSNVWRTEDTMMKRAPFELNALGDSFGGGVAKSATYSDSSFERAEAVLDTAVFSARASDEVMGFQRVTFSADSNENKSVTNVGNNNATKPQSVETVTEFDVDSLPIKLVADKLSDKHTQGSAWKAKYAEYKKLLAKNIKEARTFAFAWRDEDPADILALIALGEVYSLAGEQTNAIRAYSSMIDMFPSRADIRRWAAQRLLGVKVGLNVAVDSLEKAKHQRADHPSVYHLLAMAYIAQGKFKAAIMTLDEGLNAKVPWERFNRVQEILREDIELILACKSAKHLLDDPIVKSISDQHNLNNSVKDQIRFFMLWETDANDVDFHVYDKDGDHASYKNKELKSGGRLYADITSGYGPEAFVIEEPKAFPYKLQAHYYSCGPMGYGMGTVQILRLLKGDLVLENRPFLIMREQAYLDLGTVEL